LIHSRTDLKQTRCMHVTLLFRLLLLVSFFSSIAFSALSQKQGQALIDSLLTALPHMADDSNKVNVLGDISFNYRLTDFRKGIRYGEQCLALARKIDWKKGIGKGHNSIGNACKSNSDYPRALKHFHAAMSAFESEGLYRETAIVLMNIGTVYRPLGKYKKALSCYDKALKIARRIGNRKLQAQILGNQGVILFETGNYARQQQVSRQALTIFREIGDQNNEAWILSNLGDSYAKTGDFAKGIASHEKAIAIFDSLDNPSYKSSSLLSIGTIYYDMAAHSDPAKRQELLRLSIDYLRQSEKLLLQLNDTDYLKDVYLSLSQSQQLANDPAAALKSFQAYTALKDSLFTLEMEESIAGLETKREIEIREREIEIGRLKKRTELLYFGGGIGILLLIVGFTVARNVRQKKNNRLLSLEKQKSEELLHNILPEEVAAELKAKGAADAKLFDEVTVLFTDFKGFTAIAELLTPEELVAEIDECFSAFDQIMEKYNVEKIKTIGDAYMAAGGLPVANTTNAVDVLHAAMEIRQFMEDLAHKKNAAGRPFFQIRIGIHTGPVVAGIVGMKKFAYDIWGDTVNTAARMESSGEPGRINISGETYALVHTRFRCEYRGKIAAKNKGEIDMYFVEK
jgi:adenylate cyclase